jgi:hypothetical protein
MEIRLDKIDLWVASGEKDTDYSFGSKRFFVKGMRQSNVGTRNTRGEP